MKRVEVAISYSKAGFSVIPIQPYEKTPLIRWESYQKSHAAADEMISWWNKWPDANLGIVTGAVSRLIVIDLDTPEAKDKLKEIAPGFDFTMVPRSRTGKGGQLFFRHPGGTVPNRVGVIPGLDVRGDGGYVVAPTSIHPNGKQYRWEVPIDGDLPALPGALFRLISSQTANG
jgi:putative DNA primase/helicase